MQAHRLCCLALIVLPVAAHAACQLSQSDTSTLTVTFGGKDCPRSPEAKAAFARNLKLAVAAMNASNASPARIRDRGELRTRSQQRLYDISDMKFQSEFLSGNSHYYGQK